MCIRDFSKKLTTADERTIIRTEGQYVTVAAIQDELKNGIYLHLVAETPGESASVVPTAQTVPQIDVTTVAPPPRHEFMDGDAFLFVKGDNVCLCTTAMRDGGIRYVLQELFKKAKLRKDSAKFDLIKAADLSKAALIKNEGVKEIELKAAMYKATADYQRRKTQAFSLLGAAAKHAKALFSKENDVTNDALKVILTLKVDRRFRKGIRLGEKRIEQLATDLIKNQERDDDFTIVTKGEQQIGPDELFVKVTTQMEKVGKSVERDDAWKQIKKFYSALERAGAL